MAMPGDTMVVAVPPPPMPHNTGGLQGQQRRAVRRGRGGGRGGYGGTPTYTGEQRQMGFANQATHMPPRLMSGEEVSRDANGDQDPQRVQLENLIREFKTVQCTLGDSVASHDHRCCPFYHSDRDRRRVVTYNGDEPSYNAEPCNEQFDSARRCSRGDNCRLCHSTAELLYHPEIFRKRLCHQATRCPRGRFCAFAHSRQELLVPHFDEMEERQPSEEFIAHKFKTQWCPIGGPHDWENCVYAHTYRDWRRSPGIGYSSRPCGQWTHSVNMGPTELLYEDRCPRGMGCPLAHGSKEQLYHPHFYKTNPCSEAHCKRGSLCAFNHGDHDRRTPDEPNLRSVRDKIVNVEDLLLRFQPTYFTPPKYHALEDPTVRGSGFGFGGFGGGNTGGNMRTRIHDKQRSPNNAARQHQYFGDGFDHGAESRRPSGGNYGSGAGAWHNDQGDWGQHDHYMENSHHAMVGAGNCDAEGWNRNFMPYICQWMPCSGADEAGTTPLLPPQMGYGEVNWSTPYGCSSMPMVWEPALPYTQPVGSPSNWLTSEGQPLQNYDGGSFESSLQLALEAGGIPSIPNMHTGLQDVDSEKGCIQHEAIVAGLMERQNKYFLKNGMRTPSSLGSPPITTPTETPGITPRHAGAAGSSADGSAEFSSDVDAVSREASTKLALTVGPSQSLPGQVAVCDGGLHDSV